MGRKTEIVLVFQVAVETVFERNLRLGPHDLVRELDAPVPHKKQQLDSAPFLMILSSTTHLLEAMDVSTSEYVRFTWMMFGPLYEIEYFLCVYSTRVPTGYCSQHIYILISTHHLHDRIELSRLTSLRYSGSSFGFMTFPTRPHTGRSSTLIWYQ